MEKEIRTMVAPSWKNHDKQMRVPDDYFSKRQKAGYTSRGHTEGPKRLGWQDKGTAHLVSRKLEVSRRLARASIQKEKISIDAGDGNKLGMCPEAIEYDRQIYDAPKAGTEGPAYKIVRGVEPPVHHELDDDRVALGRSRNGSKA